MYTPRGLPYPSQTTPQDYESEALTPFGGTAFPIAPLSSSSNASLLSMIPTATPTSLPAPSVRFVFTRTNTQLNSWNGFTLAAGSLGVIFDRIGTFRWDILWNMLIALDHRDNPTGHTAGSPIYVAGYIVAYLTNLGTVPVYGALPTDITASSVTGMYAAGASSWPWLFRNSNLVYAQSFDVFEYMQVVSRMVMSVLYSYEDSGWAIFPICADSYTPNFASWTPNHSSVFSFGDVRLAPTAETTPFALATVRRPVRDRPFPFVFPVPQSGRDPIPHPEADLVLDQPVHLRVERPLPRPASATQALAQLVVTQPGAVSGQRRKGPIDV